MIGIEIDTSEQFADLAKDEEVRFFKVGKQAVRTAANRLRKAVRMKLRSIGSGRIYDVVDPVTKLHKRHIASAPGQAPARLSGALARSIRVSVRLKKRQGRIDGVVQPSKSQMRKAIWLEFGTATIRPRPFLRPAQLQEERAMGEDMRKAAEG